MQVVKRVVTIEVYRLPQYLRDMHRTMVNLKLEYETAKRSFENAIVEKLHSTVLYDEDDHSLNNPDEEVGHNPAAHFNGPDAFADFHLRSSDRASASNSLDEATDVTEHKWAK